MARSQIFGCILVPYLMFYVLFFLDLSRPAGFRMSEAAGLVIFYYLAIVMPLLGVFNASVYFYPRYTIYRQHNPEKSRMACRCAVLGIDWRQEERQLHLRHWSVRKTFKPFSETHRWTGQNPKQYAQHELLQYTSDLYQKEVRLRNITLLHP